MKNIHWENIIKSFFLGLLIGAVLQFYEQAEAGFMYKVLSVFVSGGVGFIIGFITEWLTAILPISIANARTYFFINNLLALAVTTLILASLILITSRTMSNIADFTPMILIALGIICIANLVDYMMYRRAQIKLKLFKAHIEGKKL